jgi:hypothetical protein
LSCCSEELGWWRTWWFLVVTGVFEVGFGGFGGRFGWSVVGHEVDVWCERMRCGANLCGPIPAVAGVVTFISPMINPPSTNFWIVCCRKDRGSCSCQRRWLCSDRFCLIWWETPFGITACPVSEVALSGAILMRFGEAIVVF